MFIRIFLLLDLFFFIEDHDLYQKDVAILLGINAIFLEKINTLVIITKQI